MWEESVGSDHELKHSDHELKIPESKTYFTTKYEWTCENHIYFFVFGIFSVVWNFDVIIYKIILKLIEFQR